MCLKKLYLNQLYFISLKFLYKVYFFKYFFSCLCKINVKVLIVAVNIYFFIILLFEKYCMKKPTIISFLLIFMKYVLNFLRFTKSNWDIVDCYFWLKLNSRKANFSNIFKYQLILKCIALRPFTTFLSKVSYI